METVRPVARHSPGDLCGILCFLFRHTGIRGFHESIGYKTEKRYLRLGRNVSFFKLMQDLPDRRSHLRFSEEHQT